MSGIQYTVVPGTAPTPDVSIAYELLANSVFMRTTNVQNTDGTWYEAYSYVPLNPNDTVFGDGQLATVTTQSSHTVSYTYDMLGRVSKTGLEVAGVNIGDTTSTWDDLGRLTHLTNPLGTEEIHYDGNTGRVSWSKIAGLKTTYGYDTTVPGEHRLASIQSTWNEAWNEYTNHGYGYDAAGRLTSWTRNQMPSNTGKLWAMGYDPSEQLETVGVTRWDANTPDPIEDDLHFYQYDAGGNRTSEQRGGVVRSWGANAFNQLTDQQLGGPMELRGGAGVQSNVTVTPVNEAGNPTGPAQTATPAGGATSWKARVNAGLGMNRYKVEATQAQVPTGTVPQTTTRTLQFPLGSEQPATFSYDLDGNMLSDGVRGYAWDAENRLVKVTGSAFGEVEFTYDPFHRRSRIVEKFNAQVVSDRLLRWAGLAIIGERIITTETEERHYFGNGESRKTLNSQQTTLNLLYTVDHLGSIRDLVDATTGLVRARYDYSPYGIRNKLAGDSDTEFGYTGHYTNARSGLVLAPYRAYDPMLGRWISRDPIEEDGGINLYGYVGNLPDVLVDPDGMAPKKPKKPAKPKAPKIPKEKFKIDVTPTEDGRETRRISNFEEVISVNSDTEYQWIGESRECVALVKTLSGTPDTPTTTWSPGESVSSNTPIGTFIGRGFGPSGKWPSSAGDCHSGVFLGTTTENNITYVIILNQYPKPPQPPRIMRDAIGPWREISFPKGK